MLISDPAAVNNLRSGGTGTWDIINLNNAWQRKQLYPEGLILPLDKEKFEPLYGMNTPGFEWPYHWALDESGEHLLGMIQRYGPNAMAINSDLIAPETVENGGYMEMIEGAAGQYGILDYENWVIMTTCMAAGFTPYKKHTEDEMEVYRELIFKLFKNAKKTSDDQAALARDMITGEIIGTFPGSVYTVSAPRSEGELQIMNVAPIEGPEETKSESHPNGKAGIIWIEVTSLVANPDPTPLAEAFLIYCHTPEAAYRVATKAPGTLNPVVQMGPPRSWKNSRPTSWKPFSGATMEAGLVPWWIVASISTSIPTMTPCTISIPRPNANAALNPHGGCVPSRRVRSSRGGCVLLGATLRHLFPMLLGLANVPTDAREAALDLWASRFQILRDITLPLLGPGIFAGFLFAILLSWGNFPLAYFTSGADVTVPEWLYGKMIGGYTPMVPAIGLITVLLGAAFLVVGLAINARLQKIR